MPLLADATERAPEFGSRYAYYALGMFVAVGVFNIVDRSTGSFHAHEKRELVASP